MDNDRVQVGDQVQWLQNFHKNSPQSMEYGRVAETECRMVCAYFPSLSPVGTWLQRVSEDIYWRHVVTRQAVQELDE